MQDQKQPSLGARLLFKAVDRLSGRGRQHSLQPLQRRSTMAGRPSLQHQPQGPESQWRPSHQPRLLVFTHLPLRPRCLTPSPFESPSELYPKRNEQIQSLLFTLPAEILLMIYQEVVSNQVIHIIRMHRKLGHTICKTSGDPDECKERQCRGLKLPTGAYVQISNTPEDLTSLLQTCRKIYADVIPLLYSSNIFDFDSMEGFVSMSCSLLPQRFDSIRAVKMDFRFNMSLFFSETTCVNDGPRWERTWRVLSTMGSLQRLWVRISWPKNGLYDEEEKRYLEPLWILRDIKTFEVSLPPLKDEEKCWSKDWGKEVPFQIIRRRSSSLQRIVS